MSEDIHTLAAAVFLNLRLRLITPTQRAEAKARNFYLLYSPGGDKTLRSRLEVEYTRQEEIRRAKETAK